MSEGKSKRNGIWHYAPDAPLRTAPYWDIPPRPIKALAFLIKSWNPLTWRLLMFAGAFAIWQWFTPDLNRTATVQIGWVSEIWLRNMVITVIVTGGLHLWLHRLAGQGNDYRYDARPMAKNSRVFHFNNQVWDNVFWSFIAVQWWTFWECLMYWAWANGYGNLITFDESPVSFVAVLLFIPFWAGFYFYWQHRFLHTPFMYRYVHSWHHKNINTGPWSGLAMHPVESFILMGDILILLVLPAGPLHAIFMILHHGVGAPSSHAGFDRLKIGPLKFELGDFFHQLHHKYFDCNYGYVDTPWDDWFDSFHDGTPEGDAHIKARRKALRETHAGRR
ncbi:MAG: sterol desaturase family protein [Pseudomonadota bacterium]